MILAGSAVALAIAFVALPGLLAGPVPGAHGRSLADTTAGVLAAFWRSGQATPTAGLASLTRYWRHYHEIKAVLAAALGVVLVVSTRRAVRAVLRRGAGRARLTAAAALLGAASLASAALVSANVQGIVSPRGSLLTLVPFARPGAEFAPTSAAMRRELTHHASAARAPLDVLVHDFGRYHLVLAIVAGAAAAAAAVLTGLLTRRRVALAAGSRHNRTLIHTGIGLGAALCGVLVVVAAANVSSAVDPAHALLLLMRAG